MTIGDYSRIRQKREGSLSVLAPRRHNVTPTDKNPSDESHFGDLLTPPLFGKEGDHQDPQRKQPKKEA